MKTRKFRKPVQLWDKELENLVNILEGKGMYIHRLEKKRLDLLWDMCRAAFWYRAILSNKNRAKAKVITFDDLASAYGEAAESSAIRDEEI